MTIGVLHQKTLASRRGFTLIELLVVIAVIALLVTLLVPSLKVAKKMAQQTVCMSNQRQIAIALNYYATDDEGGHFPPAPAWANASMMFEVYSDPNPPRPEDVGYDDGWFGLGLLFTTRTIDTERVLYCPGQVPPFVYPEGWTSTIWSHRHWRISSYIYRLFGQRNPGITREMIDAMHKMSLWNMPPRFALSADLFHGPLYWVHTTPLGIGVAFADGHAEFQLIAEEDRERSIYYNDFDRVNDSLRDPYTYSFWQAIDANAWEQHRDRWP
jgi:prepilin-type N-terminal cleavage/methylation domain-containing protein